MEAVQVTGHHLEIGERDIRPAQQIPQLQCALVVGDESSRVTMLSPVRAKVKVIACSLWVLRGRALHERGAGQVEGRQRQYRADERDPGGWSTGATESRSMTLSVA